MKIIKKILTIWEYFNIHVIKRMIRNRLYTGIVEYGGVEYKLLDNIADDKLINKLSDRSKYIKTIRYYGSYYLENVVYFTINLI